MKRIVLLKEGDYRPNVFNDFVETVNFPHTTPDAEQINFFAKTDYTFRIYPNESHNTPTHKLALTHYNVNPHVVPQDPLLFQSIDIPLMCEALEHYHTVLVGTPTTLYSVQDQQLLNNLRYVVRDTDGHIIDLITKERLAHDTVDIITFFGMVKAGSMPIYYLITDPSIARLGGGFDCYDEVNDIEFLKVNDQDGSFKDNVFVPTLSSTSKFIGPNNIVTTSNTVEITFFESRFGVMKDVGYVMNPKEVSVESNAPYTIKTNTITLELNGLNTVYVEIRFVLGPFFDNAQDLERPTFSYVIHKI